jgi:hypothetical protein
MENFTGIAAADELDALNTAGDFEPTTEVDTLLLDATMDAIIGARALLKRLERLEEHLRAGRDADAAEGLAIDVTLTAERLAAVTTWAV